MQAISLLLVLFLAIGIFIRAYNAWTRFLVISIIALVLLLASLGLI